MKSCLFFFYRPLNIPKFVICLWENLTGNAGKGPMGNVETTCFGDVASLGSTLLETGLIV